MRAGTATDVRVHPHVQATHDDTAVFSQQGGASFVSENATVSTTANLQDRRLSAETRFIVDVTDSLLRAAIRIPEAAMSSEFYRMPYRIASEASRKLAEMSLGRKIEGHAVTGSDVVDSLARAAENSAASAIAEPLFVSGPMKMAVGLLNMIARLGTRFLMHFASNQKIPTTGQLNLQHAPDEVVSRSLFRMIPELGANLISALGFNAESYLGKFVPRAVEQFMINTNMHHFNLVDKGLESIGVRLDPEHVGYDGLIG